MRRQPLACRPPQLAWDERPPREPGLLLHASPSVLLLSPPRCILVGACWGAPYLGLARGDPGGGTSPTGLPLGGLGGALWGPGPGPSCSSGATCRSEGVFHEAEARPGAARAQGSRAGGQLWLPGPPGHGTAAAPRARRGWGKKGAAAEKGRPFGAVRESVVLNAAAQPGSPAGGEPLLGPEEGAIPTACRAAPPSPGPETLDRALAPSFSRCGPHSRVGNDEHLFWHLSMPGRRPPPASPPRAPPGKASSGGPRPGSFDGSPGSPLAWLPLGLTETCLGSSPLEENSVHFGKAGEAA
ncbi:basic salivary proline-rich protein 3-like [Monodelphis domestica]|uniref:basic salivary proline-rich protein 3-like n=1 Tax=Monodelphis domestica TaxID=13616 RepID=UPI0024E24A2E|nr:basic salivary proline-rich protein 3-like [Monodelphis domestica]